MSMYKKTPEYKARRKVHDKKVYVKRRDLKENLKNSGKEIIFHVERAKRE